MIHRHGGADVLVDHPTTTLEELFLRIVQESELHPGRRKVAHDMVRPAPPQPGELAGAGESRAQGYRGRVSSDVSGRRREALAWSRRSGDARRTAGSASQQPDQRRGSSRWRPCVKLGRRRVEDSQESRVERVRGLDGRQLTLTDNLTTDKRN